MKLLGDTDLLTNLYAVLATLVVTRSANSTIFTTWLFTDNACHPPTPHTEYRVCAR